MEKEFLVEFTTKTVENGCFITDVIKCADCLFYRDEKRTIQLNEPISKDNLDKFYDETDDFFYKDDDE